MANHDRRNDLHNPVFRFEAGTLTMAAGGTVQVYTSELAVSGIIDTIILVLPNGTNNINTVVTIVDEDNYILYTSDALADNQTHVLTGLAVLCTPNIRIGLKASGDPGSGGLTGTMTLYGV